MIDRSYFEPLNLDQALAVLAEHPGARLVAGGTDVVVGARSGKAALPQQLVAIHRLKELSGIDARPDGRLRIGALTTHRELESSVAVTQAWSALSDASSLVGSPATRHVGTVGGNVCNASPAMELASPLLVFDAAVELASVGRTRSVPFAEFVTGPGRTAAQAAELMAAVVLAPLPGSARTGSAYIRLEYRRAMEIAIVGAAALVCVDGSNRCIEARIALTAVAPTCVRVRAAEEVLRGAVIDDSLLERASRAAATVARPIDDVRADAEYRMAMVPVIVRRALAKARDRAAR